MHELLISFWGIFCLFVCYYFLLIPLPVDGYLGCLQFLAVMIDTAMTIYIQWHMLSFLLVRYPGVKVLGHMVKYLSRLLRNGQTVFQSGRAILYSHQQCMRVAISSYPPKLWIFQFYKDNYGYSSELCSGISLWFYLYFSIR